RVTAVVGLGGRKRAVSPLGFGSDACMYQSASQGRRPPSVASSRAARGFASSRSAFSAPAQSLESLCFLRAFETAAIDALSAEEPRLIRFDEGARAASSRRLLARARGPPTDAGSDCPTQAAGTGRSQVQLRPVAPDTGVDWQLRPGTHSSTVHRSPSSHV